MERKVGEIFEYNGEWYQCVVLLVLLVIANLINVVELIEVTVNL